MGKVSQASAASILSSTGITRKQLCNLAERDAPSVGTGGSKSCKNIVKALIAEGVDVEKAYREGADLLEEQVVNALCSVTCEVEGGGRREFYGVISAVCGVTGVKVRYLGHPADQDDWNHPDCVKVRKETIGGMLKKIEALKSKCAAHASSANLDAAKLGKSVAEKNGEIATLSAKLAAAQTMRDAAIQDSRVFHAEGTAELSTWAVKVRQLEDALVAQEQSTKTSENEVSRLRKENLLLRATLGDKQVEAGRLKDAIAGSDGRDAM